MRLSLEEVQYRAKRFLIKGNFQACINFCIGAINGVPGLSWPYLYMGDSHWMLGNQAVARVFYDIFLERSSPEEYLEERKSIIERLER